MTELDKYVEEIYTEPVPLQDEPFTLSKGKKSAGKQLKDIPVGELYLLRLLL